MVQHSSWRAYFLLASLTLVWGCNWPIMKIGVHYISPLWFSAARLGLGALFMFFLLGITKRLRLPLRQDLPAIIVIACTQMAFYLGFINLALQQVNVGQSAILSYTTPIWVAPIAICFFKEPAPPLKVIGLLLGFAGIMVLFNPLHHDWSNHQLLIGNLELIGAAICSAISILYIRFSPAHSSALNLIPWQLMLGTIFSIILASLFEPHPIIKWEGNLVVVLLYTSIAASAFGYWCVITISKLLPATTTSLALLGVPLLGLVLATIFLHEPFTWSLAISLGLFILGLALVNLADALFLKRKRYIEQEV